MTAWVIHDSVMNLNEDFSMSALAEQLQAKHKVHMGHRGLAQGCTLKCKAPVEDFKGLQ